MPRSDRHAEKPSFAGTMLAAAGFGLMLLVGGVIGFAAGRSRDGDKPKALEVAQTTPPPAKTPEKPVSEKPPTSQPEPKKPEPKKPEPKKPEPKPEPKKPEPKPEPKKPVEPPPSATMATFAKDILPIFKAKCNICHGDVKNPKGDLDLRTLATALKGGDNGAGAKPGKLDESQIWKTIDDGSMPPPGKEKLTAAEMKTVRDWILAGAK